MSPLFVESFVGLEEGFFVKISIDQKAGFIVIEAGAGVGSETAIDVVGLLHQYGQLKDVTEIKVKGFVRAVAERMFRVIGRTIVFAREYIYDDASRNYLVYVDEAESA